MHRNYRQSEFLESTTARSKSERPLQNGTELDISSNGKGSLYVSRNEMYTSNRELKAKAISETRNSYSNSRSKAVRHDNYRTRGLQIAEQNFLSHAEFPDVKTAVTLTSDEQTVKTNVRRENMNMNSTNKVAKFKPFDPKKAPAHFQNSNQNVNGQNYQNYNTSQYYAEQGQGMYQYIPPPAFGQVQGSQQTITVFSTNSNTPMTPGGSSATAVAPNGERIYIPLDDSKYEIRRGNHDLYDMPQDCELHPLSSEGQFESSVNIFHSPRPVDTRGSLSDDWSSSSDERHDSETESEHETETTETDESEIANNFVTSVLKSITESVDNLVVEKEIESVTATEDDHNTDCTQTSKSNDDETNIPTPLNDEEKKQEPSENETMPEKSKNNETYLQKVVSSSSDVEDDINVKRAKTESGLKNLDKIGGLEQIDHEVKTNKRPKSKRPRAWKENRKEKHDKTKDHTKLQEKGNANNDIAGDEIKDIKNTDKDCEAKASSRDQAESVLQRSDNYETVMVDGYYQPSQIQDGQYQPYYIPDNYTFVPNYYQQFQPSMGPDHTVFIHDAYPPPGQEEVFSQIHKSLSGELINLTATPGYKPQMIEGSKARQESGENFGIISDSASTDITTEKIQNNKEETIQQPNYNISHDTEKSTLTYTVNTYEQYPYHSQFYSDTVSELPEAKPQDHGQIYVCYDEDSVYVDPESGLSFPALHVTEDNLVTVILREGVFLEITANKALRLVNHDKKLVVAVNNSGTKTCVIHPAARIYQSDSSVHAELYLGRRAKMTDELVMFGNKLNTYKFDHRIVTEMKEVPVFRDLSYDESVAFLSTQTGIENEEMKSKMNEILSHAHFWKNGLRGSTVIINGTKIVQNEKGEVSVYCGPIVFLRMNPDKMILRLKTQLVEIDIETNWNVKLSRGSHALNASHIGFIVSNGKIKASLDSHNKFQSFSMPEHRVLMLGQPISQHRPGVPGGQRRRPPGRKEEPEGDHWGYVHRNSDHDQNRVFREWEAGWEERWDYNYDQRNRNYYKRWDPEAGRWVYPARQWHWRGHR